MNKRIIWVLSVVCCLALITACFLILRYSALRQELNAVNRELADSMASWKETASLKESMQEELKAATEQLRDMELTLQESQERSAELKEDIAALEAEIQVLSPSGLSPEGSP